MFGGQFRRDVSPGDMISVIYYEDWWDENPKDEKEASGIFLGTTAILRVGDNGSEYWDNYIELMNENGQEKILWKKFKKGTILNRFDNAEG